jgi:hypothetical protein
LRARTDDTHSGGLVGRRTDEVRIEVGRVVNRARVMTKDEGVVPTAKFFGRLVYEHIEYPVMRRRRSGKRFTLFGEQVPFAYHLYSQTWRNERCLEIAVAHHFLKQRPAGRMLEVGNVLGHFGYVGHDVIDRYEQVEGILNEDIIGYRAEQRYDTVVSISTLEHVRFDEELLKDPRGSSLALESLKATVNPGGRLLVTVPLGYNDGLDDDIRAGRFSFERQACYRRVSQDGDWREVSQEEALSCRYGSEYDAANAVLVGIDGPYA